jgi:hypothetical protein
VYDNGILDITAAFASGQGRASRMILAMRRARRMAGAV